MKCLKVDFPSDFMFELTITEREILRCQMGISSEKPGGRRYLPLVFTEQGVAMLSSALLSQQAIFVNIEISFLDDLLFLC